MQRPEDSAVSPTRRRTLALLVNGSIAILGGALTALLAVFAVRPAAGTGRERWVRAANLADLTPDVPVPRVVTMPRVDGWYRTRARETVFVVWDGGRAVHAFSATCTHLGCRVRWDTDASKFRCPCHGGAYDANGRVIDGPPPRPLDTVAARIDDANASVLVRL